MPLGETLIVTLLLVGYVGAAGFLQQLDPPQGNRPAADVLT